MTFVNFTAIFHKILRYRNRNSSTVIIVAPSTFSPARNCHQDLSYIMMFIRASTIPHPKKSRKYTRLNPGEPPNNTPVIPPENNSNDSPPRIHHSRNKRNLHAPTSGPTQSLPPSHRAEKQEDQQRVRPHRLGANRAKGPGELRSPRIIPARD